MGSWQYKDYTYAGQICKEYINYREMETDEETKTHTLAGRRARCFPKGDGISLLYFKFHGTK